MRVFNNRWFRRFVRREHMSIASLCEAIRRAEAGHVDADLGGGVIKQRIPRPGQGRSGGYRAVVLYRARALAFFVYGFAKSERENITDEELTAFRALAGEMLAFSEARLQTALDAGALSEICDEQQDIQE